VRSDHGGVQSVERAFRLLELLADTHGGSSLNELSAIVGLPVTTCHRLLKTLASLGYVRQLPSRRYGLGLGMTRLSRHADLQLGVLARPYLERIVAETGETANMALLDGDRVAYVAQAPSPHAMRMFTEVGHRAFTHSTGVGKAILSMLDGASVRRIVTRAGMPRATAATIVEFDVLERELELIRERGYALDDGEQELGVRCYAVPLIGLPVPVAISVSGPGVRLTEDMGPKVVPQLKAAATALARELAGDMGTA
jgi:IclR family acetate operon transcriptional repressor